MARDPIDLPPDQAFFDPNFFNVEYFFNFIFRILDLLVAIFQYLLGIGFTDLSFLAKFLLFLALLFACGIGYAVYKYWKVREEERSEYWEARYDALEKTEGVQHNRRWQKVLDLMESTSESDWRLAIIEADTILGDLLQKIHYHGETIGERLKSIPKGDFETLNQAWEAHKVRNQIAHEGSSFVLTKREADRVIDLYHQVFKEFRYI